VRRAEELRQRLNEIDGRNYKAYKSLAGGYHFDSGLVVHIDHVQGDPYAAPSRLRLRVPRDVPDDLCDNRTRRIGLQDFLARAIRAAIPDEAIGIDAGAQEVMERTAVLVTDEWVEARIEVTLPAAGRRILGKRAEKILVRDLPALASRGLRASGLDLDSCHNFVDTVENHGHLRRLLDERKLVAFVADGALLPRETGASDRPMAEGIRFSSPDSLRIELALLNPVAGRAAITGMGIPEGVTLIVGGGYHGKSTLLRAVERGVYPHIPGDGRELVATRSDAVKIRAEDGRRVAGVDISGFIHDLPLGRSTVRFDSDDASGSTSQAANIMEALEAGARVLLLDEDTSATNFMVRDARMQALVARDQEPIIPFVDRVQELHEKHGVSTVLVMGGSGDYFEPADCVIRMNAFTAEEVTSQAKSIAAEHPTGRRLESRAPLDLGRPRYPMARSIDASYGRRRVRITVRGRDRLGVGRETVDLRAVEQIVDPSQTRAIGHALHLASETLRSTRGSITEVLDHLEKILDEQGLGALAPMGRTGEHPGNFARPRRFEIAAALNRLRSLEVES
jgi:predicted ABC-class ATPase